MTDDQTPDAKSECVACDIAFRVLMVLGVAAVAFLAWDTMSNGGASDWLGSLLSRAKPVLATVIPMKPDNTEDDADAG